ncbi:MAG: DNA polymerase IV [Alphaproteobacteria bacterium]|nr:DNA polymerase IV [Alphaproteobacteria bacterium]
MDYLCRDCFASGAAGAAPDRCPACGSPRVLAHAELFSLSIAHVDCDAFYASVEKRDNPELRDKPVIVGGGQRGVVSTCCYIARQYGVRSAMPSATARRLCPDAVFVKPDMRKYVAVSRQIRERMEALTPLVEPLSIDEAFLDLNGTEKVHRAKPAMVLARFAKEIETDIGVTLSVGLSHNKFLAKVASDLNKPRGFSIIGKAETLSFLAEKPVSIIFGVGKVFTETLARDGILSIGQLQQMQPQELIRRYGEMGARLGHLSRGEDARGVHRVSGAKSVSHETTFLTDISEYEALAKPLLALSEHVSERMKKHDLVGDTVQLKLKSSGFRIRTRARHLSVPTQLAHTIFEHASALLAREVDGTAYRLIGVGLTGLSAADGSDPTDLVAPEVARKAAAERAIDRVRGRFGRDALVRGRLYDHRSPEPDEKDES